MFREITAKFATMRKPQSFIITRDQYQHYTVQSDKSIGEFDGAGRGILNTKGSYFHHLSPFLGAKAFTFPAEFVQECQEIFTLPGEKIADLDNSPIIFGGQTSIGGDEWTLLRNYLLLQNKGITHDKSVWQLVDVEEYIAKEKAKYVESD